MADFDDVRLPVYIEQGAQIGPRFQTTVITLTSGREQRNIDWSQELIQANLGYGIMVGTDGKAYDEADITESFSDILAFFRARRGMAIGFRFRDWGDYKGKNEGIGVGNGSNALFYLRKQYGTYLRYITRPVTGTVQITVNNVPATFTLGALGAVTLTTPPANTAVVRATFEYDIPVRFDNDVQQAQLLQALAGSVPDIGLVGIREGAL